VNNYADIESFGEIAGQARNDGGLAAAMTARFEQLRGGF